MEEMFQYVKMENNKNRFFCLEQNLVSFAWWLFYKQDFLLPIMRTESKKFSGALILHVLLRKLKRFKRSSILLVAFTSYKYNIKKNKSVVALQFFGPICVAVHKGYKIFNLHNDPIGFCI